jgi:hypothetical protein
MEEIILEGALKKERALTGRDVKTDLSKIRRPPKDNIFLLHPNTGSQKPRRLGSDPIGRRK